MLISFVLTILTLEIINIIIIIIFYAVIKISPVCVKYVQVAGALAQQLRALVVLLKDL